MVATSILNFYARPFFGPRPEVCGFPHSLCIARAALLFFSPLLRINFHRKGPARPQNAHASRHESHEKTNIKTNNNFCSFSFIYRLPPIESAWQLDIPLQVRQRLSELKKVGKMVAINSSFRAYAEIKPQPNPKINVPTEIQKSLVILI
jgi:hypothetical protein